MYHYQEQVEAAQRVKDMLAMPMPEVQEDIGDESCFDPWDLFPSLYGSYSSEFDDCVIEVLRELQTGVKKRFDLASEMVREMLCIEELCEYGTSPRQCFPTQDFREMLPDLLDRWERYYELQWGFLRPAL